MHKVGTSETALGLLITQRSVDRRCIFTFIYAKRAPISRDIPGSGASALVSHHQLPLVTTHACLVTASNPVIVPQII